MKRLLIIAASVAACLMLTGCPDSKHGALTADDWAGEYRGSAVTYIIYSDDSLYRDTLNYPPDLQAIAQVETGHYAQTDWIYCRFDIPCGRFALGRGAFAGGDLTTERSPRSISYGVNTSRFGKVWSPMDLPVPSARLSYRSGNLTISATDTLDRVNEAGDSIPLITVRHEFRGAKVN